MTLRGTSPKYTPGRHKWLRKLADKPGTRAYGPGPLAHACRVLGWTTWGVVGKGKAGGEVLTEAGRQVLALWDRTGGRVPTLPAGAVTMDLADLTRYLVTTGKAQEMLALLSAACREGAEGFADAQAATAAQELAVAMEVPACCRDTPGGEVCDGDHPPNYGGNGFIRGPGCAL